MSQILTKRQNPFASIGWLHCCTAACFACKNSTIHWTWCLIGTVTSSSLLLHEVEGYRRIQDSVLILRTENKERVGEQTRFPIETRDNAGGTNRIFLPNPPSLRSEWVGESTGTDARNLISSALQKPPKRNRKTKSTPWPQG